MPKPASVGSLIAGLRALARFLEDHPDVPAPRWADVMVFPPDRTDREAQREVDTIAALIGSEVNDETANNGPLHDIASLRPGRVSTLWPSQTSDRTRLAMTSPATTRASDQWGHCRLFSCVGQSCCSCVAIGVFSIVVATLIESRQSLKLLRRSAPDYLRGRYPPNPWRRRSLDYSQGEIAR